MASTPLEAKLSAGSRRETARESHSETTLCLSGWLAPMNLQTTAVARMWTGRSPPALLVGLQTGTATVAVSQNTGNGTAI